MKKLLCFAGFLAVLAGPALLPANITPYNVDSATLHLWHLDEAATPCADAAGGGANLTALAGGATLNNSSFAGFGQALSTVDGGAAGTNNAGLIDAALSALALANGSGDNTAGLFADPTTGAFTFEAIVWIGFDPAANLGATGSGGNGRNLPMQILSGDQDSSGGGIRSWQFRLDPVGFNPNADGYTAPLAQPALEFINLNNGSGIQNLIVLIPTNGVDAIASNQWYHAAVAYNGNAAAGNLVFYWTRLDTNRSAATAISIRQMTLDLNAAGEVDLCVGNTGRTMPNNNFIGLIDEVRISSLARGPGEFVFRSVSVLVASSWQEPNVPANTLDGNLGTRWSAQGDGQWITFDLGQSKLVEALDIAFYAGNTRTTTFDVLLSTDNVSWVTALANITSSGATLNLEAFELPGVHFARYVRIVGHRNSQSDWNSLTEVVIRTSPGTDTDGDSLPDDWETTWFGNLSQMATNDFDTDAFDNLAEYIGGSNPTNALSTPLDTDADGLPDVWEIAWLGMIVYGAGNDPDNDTYNNLQEYQAGTDPDNAASNPGDTDADGLPDVWETNHFGSLAQGPSDDFDGDGFSNLQEYQAGTIPNNANSYPAGPRVRFVPIEDGNPNTSEYGYAGASAINTVNFVHSALHTVSNQQFIAYYYRHATSSTDTNNNRIVIARRTVGATTWQMFFTTFTANTIADGHDVAAFGLDGDGYLHLSWGMHGDAFHYARTTTPVLGTNAIVFGPDTTMTGNENTVTYPQWLTLPDGDLLYLFREGASGNGDTYLNRYYHSSQTWSNVHRSGSTQAPFLKGTGWTPNYNAYPNMPCLDADGNFYLVWTWRYQSDSPAGESGYQTNHDFDYARSTNGGLTWLRQNGVPYALPISQSGENGDPNTTAEKIISIPEGYSLINQAGMCLDTNRQPVIATWWAPGTGTGNYRRQYMIAFRDLAGAWQVRQVSNRTNDPAGTKYSETYVRNLGRPAVVCDRAGRIIVLYRDNAGSNGLTVVHSLPFAVDPQRTNWTTFDLTTANLGNYESVIDQARWDLDNNLHIVHQPSAGEGYTPPANTAAQIGVVEWNAAAYFAHRPTLNLALVNAGQDALLSFPSQTGWDYRIQTSTNLNSGWSNLVTLDGTGTWLEYTQTNTGAAQRYWRLEIKEGGFAP